MPEARGLAVVHAEVRGAVQLGADASGWETSGGSTSRKNPVSNDVLFCFHGDTPVSDSILTPPYTFYSTGMSSEKCFSPSGPDRCAGSKEYVCVSRVPERAAPRSRSVVNRLDLPSG